MDRCRVCEKLFWPWQKRSEIVAYYDNGVPVNFVIHESCRKYNDVIKQIKIGEVMNSFLKHDHGEMEF